MDFKLPSPGWSLHFLTIDYNKKYLFYDYNKKYCDFNKKYIFWSSKVLAYSS